MKSGNAIAAFHEAGIQEDHFRLSLHLDIAETSGG